MKKIISFFIVLLFVWSLSSGSEDGDKRKKIMVTLNGQLLFPSDSGFKDVYGSSVLYPGLKVGYFAFKKVYFFLGYDFIYKKGKTPVFEYEAGTIQHFISLGCGYRGKISAKLAYQAELGLFNVSYQEESLGEKKSDSAIGFLVDAGFIMNLGKSFFGRISLGYFSASDTVDDVSIKLGGFKTGIGLGICF